MRRDPRNTDRDTSHSIPGPAVNRSSSSDTRLAARDGKGGVTTGWMAGETALPGRLSNFGEVSPLYARDVLHVGIPDAGRIVAASRGHYAAIFWHGTDTVRGGALVAWDSFWRPLSDGGLGIRHLHHNNLALMCKWIAWVMKPADDILSHLLHEMYGSTLDWSMWARPQRGDSPFVAGLRGTFPLVQ